jgi:hypothetical protein
MTRQTQSIYRRGRRWWGDFRQYRDAGGAQEPLCAPSTRVATTDRALAIHLYAARVKQLEQARRDKFILGVSDVVGLEGLAARHLVDMAKRVAPRRTGWPITRRPCDGPWRSSAVSGR